MGIDWMQWPEVPVMLFGTEVMLYPTVITLILLLSTLAILTAWDVRSPNSERKGFLPIAFARGERLFLSIVTMVGIMLVWLALQGNGVGIPLADATFADLSLLPPLALGAVAIFAIVVYG